MSEYNLLIRFDVEFTYLFLVSKNVDNARFSLIARS